MLFVKLKKESFCLLASFWSVFVTMAVIFSAGDSRKDVLGG